MTLIDTLRCGSLCALLLLINSACTEKEVALGIGDARVTGTWRLYQRSSGKDSTLVVTPLPAAPLQTLTFTQDGGVTSAGAATSYYRSVKYYRVDSISNGLEVRLIASLKEVPGEAQGLRIQGDSMVLTPHFVQNLNLFFVRLK